MEKGRLTPKTAVREKRQTEWDAVRAPRQDGGRALAGISPVIGGQGLEHGVSQPTARTVALQEPNSERGPQGL